jgi:hypothetical protein
MSSPGAATVFVTYRHANALYVALRPVGQRGPPRTGPQVRYLNSENRILRDKLPARITVTPAERRRLIRFGKPLNTVIRELITIVSPRTFSRRLLDKKRKRKPAKVGRPPLVALRDLVA